MAEQIYVTHIGMDKLHQQIHALEERLRALQDQTGHVCDVGGNQWHDNASYEALVIDIRGVDWQLQQAHANANRVVLVGPPTDFNTVAIGCSVKILWNGDEEVWKIVGFGESDPDNNMVAYNAPIGMLLLGKRAGDVVESNIGGRTTKIQILEIFG